MTTSTWNGSTADWFTATDWSGSVVPNSGSAVADLGGAGSYTVSINGGDPTVTVGTLNITDPNALLSLGGTLIVDSAFNLGSGSLFLGGEIVGGKLSAGTGTITYGNGVLYGVDFQGTVQLTGSGAHLRVENGISLTGASGTGAGSVDLTGSNATLEFDGSQSVTGATIDIGTSLGQDNLLLNDLSAPGALLTLGSTLQLVSTGNVVVQSAQDDTIVNQGTITADTASSFFNIIGGYFTNTGTINVGNTDSFTLDPIQFDNTGSVLVNGGGVLHLEGYLYGVQLGTIKVSAGGYVSLDSNAYLNDSGYTLKVGGSSALGEITLLGTISGGTIIDAGTGFNFEDGALDGVKYQGTMNLSAGGARVRIYDGITLTTTGGTGSGALILTGGNSEVDFYGTQLLDDATVTMGGGGNADFIEAYATGVNSALTFGAGLTIDSVGPNNFIGSNGNGTVVNDGTIAVGTAVGDVLTVNPYAFVNAGTITVSAGENLYIDAAYSFSNSGTMSVTGTGIIHLQGNLVGTALGSITATNAAILSFDGNAFLNNTGNTLKVGTGNALDVIGVAGTILGGTILDGGNGVNFNDGALDGVKYEGTMNLSASGARIRIYDGITLTGASGTGKGTLAITGGNAEVDFYGTQTLDNATVTFGGGGTTDFIEAYYQNGVRSTLTLGSHLTIDSVGPNNFLGGGGNVTIVNDGKIVVGAAAGEALTINPTNFVNAGTITVNPGENLYIDAATSFSNTGTITVSGTGILHLESTLLGTALGSITASSGGIISLDNNGYLDDSGYVLQVGGSSAFGVVTLAGTIALGTILDDGSGFNFQNGALSGVVYEGTMSLTGTGARVRIYDGITLTGATGKGSGTAVVSGSNADIDFYGTQTLNNATISLGGSGNTDTIQAYVTGVSAVFTLGSHLTIDATGSNDFLVGNLGTTIVNDGTLAIDHYNSGAFTINTAYFTNAGKITVADRQQLYVTGGAFDNTGAILIESGGILHLVDETFTGQLGAITSSGGVLSIDGLLENAGSTLDVGTKTALGRVSLTGSIAGGTILDAGNGFTFSNGALDAVTYEGTMSLNTASARVGIYGGITLTGAKGTGNGAIAVTGASAELDFYGTETVDAATITLGSGNNSASLQAFTNELISTLTLGANLTIKTGGLTTSILAGNSASIVNLGTIISDVNGGNLLINSTNYLTNAGEFEVTNNAALDVDPTLLNTGKILVEKGDAFFQNEVTGAGSFQIDAAGSLELRGSIGSGQSIAFSGAGGKLLIDDPTQFAAGVSGFAKGDSLDLTNIGFGSATKLSYSGSSTEGTLTVTNGALTASILLFGQYVASGFADATDTRSGTLVTYTPPAHSTQPQLAMGH